MSDKKNDAVENFMNFILSDETPVGPEDEEDLKMFDDAVEQAELKVARARMDRARAGVFANTMSSNLKNLDIERARRIYDRAKAGDSTSGLTLAARFGDGTLDGDRDAILEDLAELANDEDDDDQD